MHGSALCAWLFLLPSFIFILLHLLRTLAGVDPIACAIWTEPSPLAASAFILVTFAWVKIFVGLILLNLRIILVLDVSAHIFISSIGKQMTDHAEATAAGDLLDQDRDTPLRW